jgi:hypothetical protein
MSGGSSERDDSLRGGERGGLNSAWFCHNGWMTGLEMLMWAATKRAAMLGGLVPHTQRVSHPVSEASIVRPPHKAYGATKRRAEWGVPPSRPSGSVRCPERLGT